MDPLAEMHLLLREHWWEPEYETFDGRNIVWIWTKPGCPYAVVTKRVNGEARWFETLAECPCTDDELTSIEALHSRLAELAK